MAMVIAHDPGGKVRIALGDGTESAVLFSPCARYRYRLERSWASGAGRVMFLMMNPSVADDRVDDPTVAKCQKYARRWGYAGLLVGNVCAYRATDKRELLRVNDPFGPDNVEHLKAMALEASMLVVAHGKLPHRALNRHAAAIVRQVVAVGRQPMVLALSKDGTPEHPLYQLDAAVPFPLVPLAA